MILNPVFQKTEKPGIHHGEHGEHEEREATLMEHLPQKAEPSYSAWMTDLQSSIEVLKVDVAGRMITPKKKREGLVSAPGDKAGDLTEEPRHRGLGRAGRNHRCSETGILQKETK
jgi:hypothetical protein